MNSGDSGTWLDKTRPAGPEKQAPKITDILRPVFKDKMGIDITQRMSEVDEKVVNAVYMRAAALHFAASPFFDAGAEFAVLSDTKNELIAAVHAKTKNPQEIRSMLANAELAIKAGLGIDRSLV